MRRARYPKDHATSPPGEPKTIPVDPVDIRQVCHVLDEHADTATAIELLKSMYERGWSKR